MKQLNILGHKYISKTVLKTKTGLKDKDKIEVNNYNLNIFFQGIKRSCYITLHNFAKDKPQNNC